MMASSFAFRLLCANFTRSKSHIPGLKNIRAHSNWSSPETIAEFISTKANKILVMAGAGISTPSGIPDFRSPDTGIYNRLQKYDLPYPEAVFDIEFFMVNPRPFYTLAKELYPNDNNKPNPAHVFVKLLHDEGKLLRMYTQNIDGLERAAGIPVDLLTEAHGTFATSKCVVCHSSYDTSLLKEAIFNGEIPRCPKESCQGVVKPDVVFFGEMLPAKFMKYPVDGLMADMLIVMGTSLEVYPFASVADIVRSSIPRILLNRQTVGSIGTRGKDGIVEGDVIDGVNSIVQRLGWQEKMNNILNELGWKSK